MNKETPAAQESLFGNKLPSNPNQILSRVQSLESLVAGLEQRLSVLEQGQAPIAQGKKKGSKAVPVRLTDAETGEVIGDFKNTSQAAKAAECSPGAIREALARAARENKSQALFLNRFKVEKLTEVEPECQ